MIKRLTLRLLIATAMTFITTAAIAQSFYHAALKIGGVPTPDWSAGAALEYRMNKKSGFEVQVNYQTYTLPSDNLFNGEQVIDYTRQFFVSYNSLMGVINIPEWEYIGAARPNATLPENVPVRTVQYQAGYRFSYPIRQSRWRWFLQPGISIAQHEWYAVYQRVKQLKETVETTPYSIDGGKTVTTTQDLQQIQTMRQESAAIFGILYDVGIVFAPLKRVTIELRANGILTPQPPYEAPLPQPIRTIQVRPQVHLGYWFGK